MNAFMKIKSLLAGQLRRLVLPSMFFFSLLTLLNSCKKVEEKPLPASIQVNEDLLMRNKGSDGIDVMVIADSLVSPLGVVALPDENGRVDEDHGSHHDGRDDDSKYYDNKKFDQKRLFVIDQIGKIWIIDRKGKRLSTPFLDISSKLVPLSPGYDERGLLGLAFHPQFKRNGRFFVYYTAPPRAGGPQ